MKFKTTLIEIALSFALYWVFIAIQDLFPFLKNTHITYYVFLPAGVKLLTILIFRWRGAIGVGLATFMRLDFAAPSHHWIDWLYVATITTAATFLVIELGLSFFKLDERLSNLKYCHLVILAVITSIVNGFVFAKGLYMLVGNEMEGGLLHNSLLLIMGNFIGNAIFVCALVLIMTQKKSIINFLKKNELI